MQNDYPWFTVCVAVRVTSHVMFRYVDGLVLCMFTHKKLSSYTYILHIQTYCLPAQHITQLHTTKLVKHINCHSNTDWSGNSFKYNCAEHSSVSFTGIFTGCYDWSTQVKWLSIDILLKLYFTLLQLLHFLIIYYNYY